MTLMGVLTEVAGERERQDVKWGGPEHDDQHSAFEWTSLIYRRLLMIDSALTVKKLTPDVYHKMLLEAAALAVAALEAHARGHTHLNVK